jgi:hypothetical protein
VKFVLFHQSDAGPQLPDLFTDRGVVDISGVVRSSYAIVGDGRRDLDVSLRGISDRNRFSGVSESYHRADPKMPSSLLSRTDEVYFTCAASPVMSGLTNRPISRGPSKSSICCMALMRLPTVADSIKPLWSKTCSWR